MLTVGIQPIHIKEKYVVCIIGWKELIISVHHVEPW